MSYAYIRDLKHNKGYHTEIRLNVLDMMSPLPYDIKVRKMKYTCARWSKEMRSFVYDAGKLDDIFK